MVDIARVGSVSAADFTANIQALSQALETRVRQVENAQERATQQILQNRAIQSRNVQQLRELNLRAAQQGLRVESGPFGQFNVTPTPQRIRETQRQEELGRLELETRKAQAAAPGIANDIISEASSQLGPTRQDFQMTPEVRRLRIQEGLERRTDLTPLEKSFAVSELLRRRGIESEIRSRRAATRLGEARAAEFERRTGLLESPGEIPTEIFDQAEAETAQLSIEQIESTGKSREQFIRDLAAAKVAAIADGKPPVRAGEFQTEQEILELQRRQTEVGIETRQQALEGARRGEETSKDVIERKAKILSQESAEQNVIQSAQVRSERGTNIQSIDDLLTSSLLDAFSTDIFTSEGIAVSGIETDLIVDSIEGAVRKAENKALEVAEDPEVARRAAIQGVRDALDEKIRNFVAKGFDVSTDETGAVSLTPRPFTIGDVVAQFLFPTSAIAPGGLIENNRKAIITALREGDPRELQAAFTRGAFTDKDARNIERVVNLLGIQF